jgi:transaldolase
MTLLEKLKAVTTVVADSGDMNAIREHHPEDATTNPSLILKAAAQPIYQPLIEQAVALARQQGGSQETQLINASDHLAVNIGVALLSQVPGKSPPRWMPVSPTTGGCAWRKRASLFACTSIRVLTVPAC